MLGAIKNREALYLAVALLTLIVILVASFVPQNVVPGGKWNIGHFPSYVVLTVTTILAVRRIFGLTGAVITTIIGYSILGILIELLQPVTGRSTSIADYLHNEAGIMVGAVFCIVVFIAERKK